MTEPPANPDPPEQPLAYDRHCVACGYNLVGLDRAGRCPECALPVADSLRPGLAGTLDPQAKRLLRRSVESLETAAATQIVGFCMPLVMEIGLAVWAWGAWRLADLPRLAPALAPLGPKALRARIGAGLLIVTTVGGAAGVLALAQRTALAPGNLGALVAVGALVLTHAAAVAYSAFTTCDYLEALARRLPAADVARRCRSARRLSPLWGGGVAVYHYIVLAWLGKAPEIGGFTAGLVVIAAAGWGAAFQILDAASRWTRALAEDL